MKKTKKKPENLSETTELMVSADYKERFQAEYMQLLIRYNGLKRMLDNWDAGKLNFTPTCPKDIYKYQTKAMRDYLDVLEVRADIENVNLNDIQIQVSNHVDDLATRLKKKKSSDTDKVIEYNLASDLSLILNQNNSLIIANKELSNQKLNENEHNKKSAILMVQTLENIYKICNNRILQDFENAYSYDGDYQDYLTMLSKYVDIYLEENNILRQWMADGNLDAICVSNSYKYNIILLDYAIETTNLKEEIANYKK